MQQSFLPSETRGSNKKVLILAAIGVIATVGVIAACFHRPTVKPTLVAEVDGVESFIAEAFGKWSAKYNKVYNSVEEQVYRLKVFRDNFYIIKKISDEAHEFTVGLNNMADLTKEEFVARYISGPMDTKRERNVKTLEEGNNPDKVDWRDKGAVTHVKDQGFCGSCWAFSATGALEGLQFVKKGKLYDLSEQELVDCSRDYGNYGCNGGLMTYSFEYTNDFGGLATTDKYPYKAVDAKCKRNKDWTVYTNDGYTDVEENNENQLESAVANAPTSVAVEADSSVFQFYTSGVIDSKSCGTDLNHGILAVGYENKASTPHWICKNSWSNGWGDNGYVRIKKETSGKKGPGICGIAMMNTYPTDSKK